MHRGKYKWNYKKCICGWIIVYVLRELHKHKAFQYFLKWKNNFYYKFQWLFCYLSLDAGKHIFFLNPFWLLEWLNRLQGKENKRIQMQTRSSTCLGPLLMRWNTVFAFHFELSLWVSTEFAKLLPSVGRVKLQS